MSDTVEPAPDFYCYPITGYDVIDGDSVWCNLDMGFDMVKRVNVRIDGVNAPESRGWQKHAGIPVALALRHHLEQTPPGQLYCTSHSWGKYARRTIGDIHSLMLFESASEFLLSNRYAKPYDGGPRSYTQEEIDDIRERVHALLEPIFVEFVELTTEYDENPTRLTHAQAGEDEPLVAFGHCYGYLDGADNHFTQKLLEKLP